MVTCVSRGRCRGLQMNNQPILSVLSRLGSLLRSGRLATRMVFKTALLHALCEPINIFPPSRPYPSVVFYKGSPTFQRCTRSSEDALRRLVSRESSPSSLKHRIDSHPPAPSRPHHHHPHHHHCSLRARPCTEGRQTTKRCKRGEERKNHPPSTSPVFSPLHL